MRQKIGVEGAVSVLMNIPHYLEFLIWIMSYGGDSILDFFLYIILQSVEMVSLLRVLSILHIYLYLPLLWLSGNCGNLGKYGSGVSDMPKAVDFMDKAFAEITKD